MANPLAGCVTSLQSSISLLNSSISILDTGVSDYPRLSRVLQTTRHFELLPESTLHSAQSELLDAITPELSRLLNRVETHLERLAVREGALIAKAELQAGRLSSSEGGRAGSRSGSRTGGRRPGVAVAGNGPDEREALRMKQLRAKKERLSYAVERLTLQAQQRERQLRMSMAAQ